MKHVDIAALDIERIIGKRVPKDYLEHLL